jgi:hypothetical protein
MLHNYHARTWRTERRAPWKRILGWLAALIPWGILIGMWWGS